MSRYIDADDLVSVLDILCDKGGDIRYWEQLKWIVADCPTADVVERKDLDKITEAHEKIGYEKGYRDGYAQANVVEVVRCKECKWYKPSKFERKRKMCWRKDVEGMPVCYDFSPTDFCSYGERRDDNAET